MLSFFKTNLIITILTLVLIICFGSFSGAEAKSSHLSPIYKALYDHNYPDVINQAERLKARYPNDHTLYYLQGFAYFKTHKTNNNNEALALQCFSKAIALNRNKGDVYLFRGMMYNSAGRYKEALDDLNRAISDKNTPVQLGELDKLRGYKPATKFHHTRMYYLRSVINKGLGIDKAAMDDINQAIALSPVPNPFHFTTRGDINFLTFQFALAYNDYQKAVTIDPKMLKTWGPMGQSALNLGNYTEAIANFKKSLEVDPEYYGIAIDLGLAYALNEEYDKALERIGQGLRENPDMGGLYNIAYFYHLNGNQVQALKFFKKAQELHPNLLLLGAFYADNTPASSFRQEQLKTAKFYLKTGKTPAATASENRKPSLKITGLTLQPDPVKVNTAFDIVIDFKADIPGSKQQIPILFYFTISQNDKILFKSNSNTINSDNSKVSNWIQHMNPVPAKGVYTIKTFVKYKKLLTEKSITLTIK